MRDIWKQREQTSVSQKDLLKSPSSRPLSPRVDSEKPSEKILTKAQSTLVTGWKSKDMLVEKDAIAPIVQKVDVKPKVEIIIPIIVEMGDSEAKPVDKVIEEEKPVIVEKQIESVTLDVVKHDIPMIEIDIVPDSSVDAKKDDDEFVVIEKSDLEGHVEQVVENLVVEVVEPELKIESDTLPKSPQISIPTLKIHDTVQTSDEIQREEKKSPHGVEEKLEKKVLWSMKGVSPRLTHSTSYSVTKSPRSDSSAPIWTSPRKASTKFDMNEANIDVKPDTTPETPTAVQINVGFLDGEPQIDSTHFILNGIEMTSSPFDSPRKMSFSDLSDRSDSLSPNFKVHTVPKLKLDGTNQDENILQSPLSERDAPAFVPIFGREEVEEDTGSYLDMDQYIDSFMLPDAKKSETLIQTPRHRRAISEMGDLSDIDSPGTPRVAKTDLMVYIKFDLAEDEDFVNPFYEEAVICENLLFEEEFEFENPLYDELIEFINPFYNGHLYYEKIERPFFLGIVSAIKLGDHKFGNHIYKNTFLGSDLINCLSIYHELMLCDVLFVAQDIMNKDLFRHCQITPTLFEIEGVYHWIDSYTHPNLMNAIPHTDLSLEPKIPEDLLLLELYANWKQICKDFVKVSSKKTNKISYKLISVSEEYANVKKCLYRLQKFDPLVLTPMERKAFFINLYNIMLVDEIITCGRASNIFSRIMFSKNKFYVVGRFKLSLDDIEMCLLRNDMKIPSQLFVRCRGKSNTFALSCPADPRVHFALHKATLTSPMLRFYPPNNLVEQLALSTKIYLQDTVAFWENEIHIPRTFNIFMEDFGVDLNERLLFIRRNLNSEGKKKMDEVRAQELYIVRFLAENWTLNEKEKDEELTDLKLEYNEIIVNPDYRPYFSKFCKSEFSDENLLCFQEIESWRKLPDEKSRLLKAREIVDTFLKVDAKREININREPVVKITKIIQEEYGRYVRYPDYVPRFGIEAFDEIEGIIRFSMIDAYCRFKRCADYQSLLLLQLENSMKKVKETSGAQNQRVSPYYASFFQVYDKMKESLTIRNTNGTEILIPPVERVSFQKRAPSIVTLDMDQNIRKGSHSPSIVNSFATMAGFKK